MANSNSTQETIQCPNCGVKIRFSSDNPPPNFCPKCTAPLAGRTHEMNDLPTEWDLAAAVHEDDDEQTQANLPLSRPSPPPPSQSSELEGPTHPEESKTIITSTLDEDETIRPVQVQEFKGILGSRKAFQKKLSREEEHTLNHSIDVKEVLKTRELPAKLAAPPPHLGASFPISNTLQQLSLRDTLSTPPHSKEPVQFATSFPRDEGFSPPKTLQDSQGLALSSSPPSEARRPPKSSLPPWLVWTLGALLWIGVAFLLWKVATAPSGKPIRQDPVKTHNSATQNPPRNTTQVAPRKRPSTP